MALLRTYNSKTNKVKYFTSEIVTKNFQKATGFFIQAEPAPVIDTATPKKPSHPEPELVELNLIGGEPIDLTFETIMVEDVPNKTTPPKQTHANRTKKRI
jgi:hypothetical protein